MSNGPTILYDKSAIQRFSREEADWLTHFFRGVITPVYLLEVLGDLAKTMKVGSSTDMVAALAARTTSIGSMANVDHVELISQEILGNPVEMRGAPVVGGARRITDANGKTGIFFDESPEEKILRRWQDREFHDDEHTHAKRYRHNAKNDKSLEEIIQATKGLRQKSASYATSVGELLKSVDLFLDDPTSQFRTLDGLLEMFDQPESSRVHVKKQWVAYGRPLIRKFLPYSHHVARVSQTFMHGVGLGLISQRPTNIIDMQYLYYLPFCQVFTSADKLHIDLAPHFLRSYQRFIPSDNLHSALKQLAEHYRGLTDEERGQGSMNYAAYPSLLLETAIHRLYDELMPDWRKRAVEPKVKTTPEMNARLMEHLRPMLDAIKKTRPNDA